MTGTDNPGRRNGKPADVDDRHAMQSYVGHSVAAVRRKLDALGDGTRTRQSDQEALQREADALQTTLDILNAPEDSEMSDASAAEAKPAPKPAPEPKAGPPRPTPAQRARQQADAIDRQIAAACPLPPIIPPREGRWDLLTFAGGSQGGELLPPKLQIDAATYQRLATAANEREAALIEGVRAKVGGLPEVATALDAGQRLDHALRELARVERDAAKVAQEKDDLWSGKNGDLRKKVGELTKRAAELEGARQAIEGGVHRLQAEHSTSARQALLASVEVARTLANEVRQQCDGEQRGWRKGEALEQLVQRVGCAAVVMGRVGAPSWAQATAESLLSVVLGGSIPQPPPPVPTAPAPAKPPFYGVVEVRT